MPKNVTIFVEKISKHTMNSYLKQYYPVKVLFNYKVICVRIIFI